MALIFLSLCCLITAPLPFQQETILRVYGESVLSQQSSIPAQNTGSESRRKGAPTEANAVAQRPVQRRLPIRINRIADRPKLWVRAATPYPVLPAEHPDISPRAPPAVC